MSDPEIARRCLRCGASIRARAEFCAQCGQAMRSEKSGVIADGGSVKMNVEERKTLPGVVVAARDEGRRRKAEERVARMRERSLVVLDEAADDPSLRFVLVAFLIFAIFVIVLLLSLVLG